MNSMTQNPDIARLATAQVRRAKLKEKLLQLEESEAEDPAEVGQTGGGDGMA
jgi:hypothetical protein